MGFGASFCLAVSLCGLLICFDLACVFVTSLRIKRARLKRHLRRAAEELVDEVDLPLFDEVQWREAPASWPQSLAKLFIPLGPHQAATEFVMNAPPSSPQALIYQALCQLPVNEFDLQALLYPAGSHLLTTRQLEMLLTYTGPPSELRVLDVGAGDGCITKNLKALGLRLVATETSLGMATRLRMNGYEVWCEELQLFKDFAMKRVYSINKCSME